jgi:hypothetical protein
MLENIVQTAKGIDYRILDELNSPETELAMAFKQYLNTLETITFHWQLVNSKKYLYRIANYGSLDLYMNELPR